MKDVVRPLPAGSDHPLPRFLFLAPDLGEDEITTLARIIIGKLPPNTPIRPSPLPDKN